MKNVVFFDKKIPIQETHTTEIQFSEDISDDMFILPKYVKILETKDDTESYYCISTLMNQKRFIPLVPSYVPQGFAFTKAVYTKESQGGYLQLIYSDGLNSFSIFETTLKINYESYRKHTYEVVKFNGNYYSGN